MVWQGGILSFFIGMAVGSFLNVVIFRLGRESLRGRSRCPSCGKMLGWYELIPVASFFLQRGRCRSCNVRLSFQYPLVEFLCGALFGLVWLRFSLWPPVGAVANIFASSFWWVWPIAGLWFVYAAGLLAIAVYDAKTYLIPDALVKPLILLGGFGAIYQHILTVLRPPFFPRNGVVFMGPESLFLGRTSGNIVMFLIGSAVAFFLIGAVYFFSRGRAMGFGDVKLAIFMGLALGWPDITVALMVAFAAGTLFALPLLILRKKHMKSVVPFGPFLAFGTLAAMLAGDRLTEAYFRIFPNLFL